MTNFNSQIRKIEIQRKVDRYLGPSLCGLISIVLALKKKAVKKKAFAKPKTILIILLSEMGSLVLMQPMLRYLKARYPRSNQYVLSLKRNREVIETLEFVPKTNILTIDEKDTIAFVGDIIRFVIETKKRAFDVVIDCELFSRISSILSFLSRATLKVGFSPHTMEGLYRGGFIDRPVMYNPYVHISQQYLTLAEAIESSETPPAKRTLTNNYPQNLRIAFSQEEKDAYKKKLIEYFPGILSKERIFIYPGGGLLPIRAWPLHNFSVVAKKLIDAGFNIGTIGLKTDKKLGEAIQRFCGSPRMFDLTGYTQSFRELLLLLHFCSLLITNDGGPGHFAALTGTPTIILWGPETPLLYSPIKERNLNLYRAFSCSPCLTAYNHRNSPCDGNNVCLKSITPEDVIGGVRAMRL